MAEDSEARGVVVLVVDDHADTREMYVEYLNAMGLITREATSCATALSTVRGERVDAVVLDRRLPDGDGLDVCRELRRDPRLSTLPIIVISGKADDGATGADAYLMKPVIPDALFEQITRLVSSRRTK
ncbi:MAG TPA: response regulator [Terriglobales bacterium]|nr:response regulator [Terriglobales bacterium]